MNDYEIVWSGSMRDTYLCVDPNPFRDLSHVQPALIQRGRPLARPWVRQTCEAQQRRRIIDKLAERDCWPSNALRGHVKMSAGDYYRQLAALSDAELITWEHGWVALRRSGEQ